MVAESFNEKIIATEVINVLAKHEIAIACADTVFDRVKEELMMQQIQPVEIRSY